MAAESLYFVQEMEAADGELPLFAILITAGSNRCLCRPVTARTPYPCSDAGIFALWLSVRQKCLFIWAAQCKVWDLQGCFSCL